MKALVEAVHQVLSNYKGEYAIQSFVPNLCKLYRQLDSKTFIGLIGPMSKKQNVASENKLISNFENEDYDFITYDIEYFPENSKHCSSFENKPLLFYYITNKGKEEKARKYNANLIWADYENINYQAPKLIRNK